MITKISKHEYKVAVPLVKPVTVEDLDDMRKWCTSTFGTGGRNLKYRWRYGWISGISDSFYFRNEKDALFFVLRWA